MTKTMVYKAVKRADFEYSNAARGYVYRGEKISDAEAEKLKHKWAKKRPDGQCKKRWIVHTRIIRNVQNLGESCITTGVDRQTASFDIP